MLEMYGLSESLSHHYLGSELLKSMADEDEFIQIPLKESSFLNGGTTIISREKEIIKEDGGFSADMDIRRSTLYDNFTTIGR